MSDWPQRYNQVWDSLLEDTDGEYMVYEDFDYLLRYCAEIVKRDTKGYSDIPLPEIKKSILIEMERYIKEN